MYKFYMPPKSLMGEGCSEGVIEVIEKNKFKKALIVCDKILVENKLLTNVTKLLNENNCEYVVFDGVQPNPTVTNVEDGLKVLKNENCDYIISFGGGSPHDCAKGIALLATNGGNIKDYEGVNKSKKPQLPLIAINTTAGTASEMTIFTIITDEEKHIKMAIVDENVLPIVAINDPKLMVSMPKSLTAATGMDALTHAVEAYVSTASTPITDACAVKTVKLVFECLETAVKDGENINARDKMAYAEYLAGMAFSNASLGYVHAMAHQLGGYYDLPHGVCNAILLPYVCEFNKKASTNKYAELAKEIGIKDGNDEELANKFIQSIKDLSKRIDIPEGLSEFDVFKESDIPILTENALKDACGLTNPIKAKETDIINIYKNAM